MRPRGTYDDIRRALDKPRTIDDIAFLTGRNRKTVIGLMTRRRDLFRVCGKAKGSKAHLWTRA